MAKKEKEIALPTQMSLLVNAINCKNEDVAKLLVNQAVKLIYGDDVKPTPCDVDTVISLIRGIESRNTIEAMLAAQIVALNLQGMMTMGSQYMTATAHGMMLLRLSHQTLDMLLKYRSRNIPKEEDPS